MKITKRIGVMLLCAFLILTGLNVLLDLSFQGFKTIVGALAIAAAVFLLIDR